MVFGADAKLITFFWGGLNWTTIYGEFGEATTSDSYYFHAGSEAGYQFVLSGNLRHRLRLGLGFDFGMIHFANTKAIGLFLTPEIIYQYKMPIGFFVGLGFKMPIYTVPFHSSNDYPLLFNVFVPFGF